MWLRVLVAEQAVLAGVRVQPAHRDARPVDEGAQRGVGQGDHVADPFDGHALDGLAQRDVRADMGDRQLAGGQHHRVASRRRTHAAISSVWPTNVGSVSCVASLFIGIVTRPAT